VGRPHAWKHYNNPRWHYTCYAAYLEYVDDFSGSFGHHGCTVMVHRTFRSIAIGAVLVVVSLTFLITLRCPAPSPGREETRRQFPIPCDGETRVSCDVPQDICAPVFGYWVRSMKNVPMRRCFHDIGLVILKSTRNRSVEFLWRDLSDADPISPFPPLSAAHCHSLQLPRAAHSLRTAWIS
jgi:hypothetical protein